MVGERVVLEDMHRLFELGFRRTRKISDEIGKIGHAKLCTEPHRVQVLYGGRTLPDAAQQAGRECFDADLHASQACLPEQDKLLGSDIRAHLIKYFEFFSRVPEQTCKSIHVAIANDAIGKQESEFLVPVAQLQYLVYDPLDRFLAVTAPVRRYTAEVA